jgi:hypothetical protein
VLSIQQAVSGGRFREVRDYVSQAKEHVTVGWPICGPRSLLWVLWFCVQQTGAGPVARAH